MVGKWQMAGEKLAKTLEKLERQEEKELMPHLESLQKDINTVVQIDMNYGQKWADAAAGAGIKSWQDTYSAMGCQKTSGPCTDPAWFLGQLDKGVWNKCSCTSFPVSVTNAKNMQCSVSNKGDYVCMYI